MDLIIGILLVLFVLNVLMKPDFNMGWFWIIAGAITLFSFFGPIGPVLMFMYMVFRRED